MTSPSVYLSIYVVSQHNWIVFLGLTLIKVKRSSLILTNMPCRNQFFCRCQCVQPHQEITTLSKLMNGESKLQTPFSIAWIGEIKISWDSLLEMCLRNNDLFKNFQSSTFDLSFPSRHSFLSMLPFKTVYLFT